MHRNPGFADPSTPSSPFVSAPSSPGRWSYGASSGLCTLSASASPNWAVRAERLHDSSSFLGVPFCWEEKPGTPKRRAQKEDEEAFEFGAGFLDMEDSLMSPTPANELLVNGQIRPLKPPPRLHQPSLPLMAPPSPSLRSPLKGGKSAQDAFDPFAMALREMSKDEKASPKRRNREELFSMDLIFGKKHRVKSSKELWTKKPKGWALKQWFRRKCPKERDCWTSDSSQFSKGSGSSDASESFYEERDYCGTRNMDISGRMFRKSTQLSAQKLSYDMERTHTKEPFGKKTLLSYRQGWLGCLGFTSQGYKTMVSNISHVSAS